MLLYVMNDHPSVSETFVVNEASAVNELGIPVAAYALKAGRASKPANSVDLVVSPPSPVEILKATLRATPKILRDVSVNLRELSLREWTRSVFAQAHAQYALDASRRAGVTHLHAHFLGRSADVAQALAELLGCRWTVTAHGSDVYAPQEPGLLRRRLEGTASVACASKDVQRKVVKLAAPQALETAVVRCGVDTDALASGSARVQGDPRHVVTVGRLVATKGYWTIMEAALTLMRDKPGLRWTLAGDGPLREVLLQDVRHRELSPRLVLTGAVEHAASLDLIRDADLFVLPCEKAPSGSSDGIPVALMEAMALGVPVVTTPMGGIPELVVPGPGQTGFLVEPGDPLALATIIEKILYGTKGPRLDMIRAAARVKVENEFDRSREAAALIRMVEPYLAARETLTPKPRIWRFLYSLPRRVIARDPRGPYEP